MQKRLPLTLKLAFTAFVFLWVNAYLRFYGPQNFLWLCDLANFLILIGLWLESPLLLSSQLVSVLVIDVIWCLDLAGALALGFHPIGGTEYMFRADLIPLPVRLLSLFHVFVWPLLIFAVLRLGYDRRGWRLQTLIAWLALPLSYWLTEPDRAINWVWGPFGAQQDWMPPAAYLLVCMLVYPLLIYLPTHGLVLAARRLLDKRPRHVRIERP